MKRLKSFLTTRKDAKVLDIGTGNGNFIKMVQSLFDNYEEIIGIDNSNLALESAKRIFKDERVSFQKMDMYKLDFPDNYFDIVTISNSLHHVEKPKELFDEIKRVLGDYGIIIVNEMISDGLSKRQKSHLLMHHFAAEIDRELGRYHNETLKGKDAVVLLQEASGLKVKSVFEVKNARKENSAEELEWLYNTIDKVLEGADNSKNKIKYRKRAEKIKKHIHKHGFEGATQLVVVLG